MKKHKKRPAVVMPGIEVFLQGHVHLVKGKRVGLVTNPTGVDSFVESSIMLFHDHPDIELVALFGPEHGIAGSGQAGEPVPAGFDDTSGLPVFSLYGQDEKTDPEWFQNLDHKMRFFDTRDRGKRLEGKMLNNIDAMIFDLQDVGTRIYTYAATMAYCMEGCARRGAKFIVLDRPNPVNGVTMEGPLIDYPESSSFVGLYPVPVRHGLTLGELARLVNELYIEPKADLTVIPMKGWRREMWFDDTGLPWISPSPNMPTLMTASVYPGQVFLEGTNVSEGRGTALPFEQFGAPWIDGPRLGVKLNRLELPGIVFRMNFFRPAFSKYAGQLCQGCQIHILQREEYKPVETALNLLRALLDDYPDRFEFFSEYFDAVMGTDRVRIALLEGQPVIDIVESFSADLKEFERTRKPYLIY